MYTCTIVDKESASYDEARCFSTKIYQDRHGIAIDPQPLFFVLLREHQSIIGSVGIYAGKKEIKSFKWISDTDKNNLPFSLDDRSVCEYGTLVIPKNHSRRGLICPIEVLVTHAILSAYEKKFQHAIFTTNCISAKLIKSVSGGIERIGKADISNMPADFRESWGKTIFRATHHCYHFNLSESSDFILSQARLSAVTA